MSTSSALWSEQELGMCKYFTNTVHAATRNPQTLSLLHLSTIFFVRLVTTKLVSLQNHSRSDRSVNPVAVDT